MSNVNSSTNQTPNSGTTAASGTTPESQPPRVGSNAAGANTAAGQPPPRDRFNRSAAAPNVGPVARTENLSFGESNSEVIRSLLNMGALLPFPQAKAEFLRNAPSLFSEETRQLWRGISKRAAVRGALEQSGNTPGRNLQRGVYTPYVSANFKYGSGGPASWRTINGPVELFSSHGPLSVAFQQNAIGDCFLLASLATIAATDPSAITDMIAYDSETGTYNVTFYDLQMDEHGNLSPKLDAAGNPIKVTVEVSPEILVYNANNEVVGAQVTDLDGDGEAEIGPALIEKAFAAFMDHLITNDSNFQNYVADLADFNEEARGFNLLDEGGWGDLAVMAITGQPMNYSNYINDPTNNNYPINNSDALWKHLSAANNNGTPIIVGTKPDDEDGVDDGYLGNTGLVASHAYQVLGTVVIDGERYVALRNPWGIYEPAGNGDNDGIFLIPFDELEQHVFDVSHPPGAESGDDVETYDNPNEFASVLATFANLAGVRNDVNAGAYQPSFNSASTGPSVGPSFGLTYVVSAFAGFNATEAGIERWEAFIADMVARQGAMIDVAALVQYVLRESYQETTLDLAFYAQKVKYFNDLKKQIRDELTKARNWAAANELATLEDDADITGLDEDGDGVAGYIPNTILTGAYTYGEEDESGDTAPPPPIGTKAEFDAYIEELESKLQTVGDDAQLANVDLQNILQKQQQVLQMMSNISKMLYDTAMAIIRKIG